MVDMLEKTIKNERLKVSFHERLKSKNFKISDEIAKICKRISQDNNIPFSIFEEIFRESDRIAQLFNLLHFGYLKEGDTEEANNEQNQKSRLKR